MDDGVDTYGMDGLLVAQVAGEERKREHEPGHVPILSQLMDEHLVVDQLQHQSQDHVILKRVLSQ